VAVAVSVPCHAQRQSTVDSFCLHSYHINRNSTIAHQVAVRNTSTTPCKGLADSRTITHRED